MSFPEKFPLWATDNLQTAAPFNPTKVEPPQALKDEGWIPDLRPPAEYWNWWMNNVGRWIQAYAASQPATLLQFAASQQGVYPGATAPTDVHYDGEYWYVCGASSASGGTRRSSDSIFQVYAVTTPAGAGTQNAVGSNGAGSGAGVVISVGTGGEIVRSADSGDTWAVAEAPASITTEHFQDVIWDSSASLFVAVTSGAGASDGEIWTSPTGVTGAWTNRATPAGASDIRKGATYNGTTVFAAGDGIIASLDAITWVHISLGAIEVNVVGHSAGDSGYFLALDVDGNVFRSSDGTTWGAAQATDVLGSSDGFGSSVASDDGAAWVANITLASGQDTYGYSTDAGLTWTIAPYNLPGFFSGVFYAQGHWVLAATDNNGSVFHTPVIL